jgi:hypothetical protein
VPFSPALYDTFAIITRPGVRLSSGVRKLLTDLEAHMRAVASAFDLSAVLRPALVARAARALHSRRRSDPDPDHVLQPPERHGRQSQLRELPVACLKDTGGDAAAATELIQTEGPTLLNGWDTLTSEPDLPSGEPTREDGGARLERATSCL